MRQHEITAIDADWLRTHSQGIVTHPTPWDKIPEGYSMLFITQELSAFTEDDEKEYNELLEPWGEGKFLVHLISDQDLDAVMEPEGDI